MTKSELIDRLAAQFPQLVAKDAELAVKMILDAMAESLAKGERISPLVTYAESVSGPAQDKREYEALLREAAALDVDQPKARNNRLANVLAQRRARYLLAHEDDVFTD